MARICPRPPSVRSCRPSSAWSRRHAPRVADRLAATRLILGKLDVDVQRAEQANRVGRRVREKTVAETGDEERDSHGGRGVQELGVRSI